MDRNSLDKKRRGRESLFHSTILRPIADNAAWTKTDYTLFVVGCGEHGQVIPPEPSDVVAASGTDDGVTAIWTFDRPYNGPQTINTIFTHIACNAVALPDDSTDMVLTINGVAYNFGNIFNAVQWFVFKTTGLWSWANLKDATLSITPTIGNLKDTAFRSLYLELF